MSRPCKDWRWINWHINRGHMATNVPAREVRRYIRSVSYRRVL